MDRPPGDGRSPHAPLAGPLWVTDPGVTSVQTSAFRALTHYRALPALVGTTPLVIAALARAPYAMLPLGLMSAFTAASGSVAVGGTATATYAACMALASPLIGRWSDRAGQRLVLLVLAPICILALASAVAVAHAGLHDIPMLAVCALAGLASPPVGSFTRARWVARSPEPRVLAAAFSYESMVDEFTFVIGPVLVGLTSLAAPTLPLLTAAALIALFGIPFGLTAPRTAVDRPARTTDTTRPSILRVLATVSPAILAMTCVGTLFGSLQTATTARAAAAGTPGLGGLVYAAMGIGSALIALLVVLIPERITLPMRLVVTGLGAASAIAVGATVPHLALLAATLFVAGLFIGTLMVTSFTLAERLSPEGGLSVAMTAMPAAITVGVAIGSALGGSASSAAGPTAGMLVASGAAFLSLASPVLLALLPSRTARTTPAGIGS